MSPYVRATRLLGGLRKHIYHSGKPGAENTTGGINLLLKTSALSYPHREHRQHTGGRGGRRRDVLNAENDTEERSELLQMWDSTGGVATVTVSFSVRSQHDVLFSPEQKHDGRYVVLCHGSWTFSDRQRRGRFVESTCGTKTLSQHFHISYLIGRGSHSISSHTHNRPPLMFLSTRLLTLSSFRPLQFHNSNLTKLPSKHTQHSLNGSTVEAAPSTDVASILLKAQHHLFDSLKKTRQALNTLKGQSRGALDREAIKSRRSSYGDRQRSGTAQTEDARRRGGGGEHRFRKVGWRRGDGSFFPSTSSVYTCCDPKVLGRVCPRKTRAGISSPTRLKLHFIGQCV